MTKKYFEVQQLTKTVARVLVEASNKENAIKIANDNDLFSNAKEEVLNVYHKAGKLPKVPEGRIINTVDGYIEPNGTRHNTRLKKVINKDSDFTFPDRTNGPAELIEYKPEANG